MIKKKKAKKNVSNIQSIFVGLFMILIINIIYLAGYKTNQVAINPYNPRLDQLEESVIRGNIFARDYEVLAESVELEDGKTERIYPYSNIFSHVVGYTIRGKSGIESEYNYDLLSSNESIIRKIINELFNEKNQGNHIVTTLDANLQTVAYEGLGDFQGAVVAMDPSTGKILAMVSKPDFDPNEIEFLLNQTNSSEVRETYLFNRATQGLYPPGSTYKMLTALYYIMENPDWEDFEYVCQGKGRFFNNDISCFNQKAHGQLNLKEAFAQSCNTTFAHIGTLIEVDGFKQFNESFLFNQRLPYGLNHSRSSFVLDSQSTLESIPETVIGQGRTEITPLHNALMTSTIANGGIMMTPYLVDRVEDEHGNVIKKYMPDQYKRIVTSNEAFLISELMQSVVTEGTATSLNNLNYTVAGKTGTAEHKEGARPHSWFVGFAPVENPEIVVSIIVESSGTGGQYAVPIAKRMFETYLNE
ncbi:cell division protein FtsI/penicillin-binding protein 2 [Natranaerovirga hydrolytica]|uniref:Cell division protein FtsI/penicillin-binding protein 2 n=1 Tax=Natranaerovirga hydrolytica TaxID=680378 RepID=A0A4R1N5F4_9FIRM|nr:penicillin-binding transpeptidase domain-containing protein [Natranaerovirga hydrolytica]TCK98209.1 cell division protein FtsI/penicillin-binding protein 2 [Natranaerovirga hydrolytica]